MPLVLYARRVRRPRLQSKPHTLPGCRQATPAEPW